MPDRRFPSLAAGDLRQAVRWRRFNPAKALVDDFGQSTPGFDEMGTHYARIVPLTGAALVNASQVKPLLWYEVTMRAVGALNGLDQLVWNGRTLTVEYALDADELGIFLTIHATAEVLNPTPAPS